MNRTGESWRDHVDRTHSAGLFGEETHIHTHPEAELEARRSPCGHPVKPVKKYSLTAILFSLLFVAFLLIFLVVY